MYVSGKYLFCRPTTVQKWTMFLHIFPAYAAGKSMCWHGSKKMACPKQGVNHKSAWKKEAYFIPKSPYWTRQYARKRMASTYCYLNSLTSLDKERSVVETIIIASFVKYCHSVSSHCLGGLHCFYDPWRVDLVNHFWMPVMITPLCWENILFHYNTR